MSTHSLTFISLDILKHAELSVEMHGEEEFRTADFPRVAESEPVVGELDLVTVFYLLMKDSVFITNAVSVRGI